MSVARLRAWITSTPYARAVHWTTGGTEDGAVHLWLELTDRDGRRGLSETPVKPSWTGLDAHTAIAAVEHLVAPRLLGQDTVLAETILADIRGLPVLRAAVGHALADLSSAGEAVSRSVAAVLTRAAPEKMAEVAYGMIGDHGVRAVKVKAGQGVTTDRRALELVRARLGEGGKLSVDANSAYDVEEGIELCAAAAEAGADFVEDPWPLAPDAATGRAIASAACPVCADVSAGETGVLSGMIDRGISWVAIKPNRIGPEAARRNAATAKAAGVLSVSGLFGEGPLGALQQVRGVPGDTPIEAIHFLQLTDPVPVAGLKLADGVLSAPAGRASELVSIPEIMDRSIAAIEVSR